MEAYGNVDELNSVIGLARTFLRDNEVDGILQEVQKDLFVAGADLASVGGAVREVPRISKQRIAEMEKTIDKFEVELSPLKAFILPGGGAAGSVLHFARTVARRAERHIVALSKIEKTNEQMIPYMNRLSDLLFVIARVTNHRENKAEIEWHPTE